MRPAASSRQNIFRRPRNIGLKIRAPGADPYQMGILQAVVVAATMMLITFAWQLTFEAEALEESQ